MTTTCFSTSFSTTPEPSKLTMTTRPLITSLRGPSNDESHPGRCRLIEFSVLPGLCLPTLARRRPELSDPADVDTFAVRSLGDVLLVLAAITSSFKEQPSFSLFYWVQESADGHSQTLMRVVRACFSRSDLGHISSNVSSACARQKHSKPLRTTIGAPTPKSSSVNGKCKLAHKHASRTVSFSASHRRDRAGGRNSSFLPHHNLSTRRTRWFRTTP